MKSRTILVAAAALLAFSSACAPETETEETPDAAVIDQPPAVEPAPTQPTTPFEQGATLALDSLAGAGAYLTDQNGRAVYVLEGESGESECYDACAAQWPPVLAGSESPEMNVPGLQSDQIGTIERTDGTTQLTYAGHPLYYYHDDVEPGQTTGQDMTDEWGEWYLVTPEGEPLEPQETS